MDQCRAVECEPHHQENGQCSASDLHRNQGDSEEIKNMISNGKEHEQETKRPKAAEQLVFVDGAPFHRE